MLASHRMSHTLRCPLPSTGDDCTRTKRVPDATNPSCESFVLHPLVCPHMSQLKRTNSRACIWLKLCHVHHCVKCVRCVPSLSMQSHISRDCPVLLRFRSPSPVDHLMHRPVMPKMSSEFEMFHESNQPPNDDIVRYRQWYGSKSL